MSVQVIGRDRLGELTRVGQGGQGVVYRAPKARTRFAASMVYKEYKSAVVGGIDFGALAAMPALVEDALTYAQAERLVSVAAWPCALVGGEGSGGVSGFVMPAIPEAFFTTLVTAKGTSSTTAEFQHLLNHASVLAARGIALSDAQRYALLRETASALAFLHKHGVCVGDISPKNLLYSLVPHEAVYVIDCDAMRVNGVSALAQVETPGWEVPAGEELATIYSDTYKLGLLALRLLAGDQDTTNVGHVPAGTPGLLRQLIVDTLSNPPERRPLPEAWTYVLGHAIEEAQHRASVPVAPVDVAVLPAPEVPVLHTRPTTGSKKTAANTPSTYSTPSVAAYPNPPIPASKASMSSEAKLLAAIAAVIAVGLVVILSIVVTRKADSSQETASASTPTQTYSSSSTVPAAYSSAPVAAPPIDPEAAALQQLQQLADGDRGFVSSQLADRWVPQLSSKRPGIVDDGVVYNDQLTLQEHQRLRQQYNAKLLWSGDWSNFDASNFWVTIVPITFPDSASALRWCTAQGFDADHCYAEVVSTTRSGSGSTAHN